MEGAEELAVDVGRRDRGGAEGCRWRITSGRRRGGVLQLLRLLVAEPGCCGCGGCLTPGLGAAAAVAAGRRGWVLRLLLLLDAGVRCCGCWGCWTPGRGLLAGLTRCGPRRWSVQRRSGRAGPAERGRDGAVGGRGVCGAMGEEGGGWGEVGWGYRWRRMSARRSTSPARRAWW